MDELKIISTSSDETVRIWDAGTGKQVGEPLVGHAAKTSGVAISTDGTKILSGGWDGKIIMWRAETRTIIRILKPRMSGGNLRVMVLSFSHDDKTFAAASCDGTCTVWNSETGELLLDFEDHQNTVETVAYSPSGVKIASGSSDHTIRIRNTHTGERLTQPLLHADSVRSMVWSPDSRQLISACQDGQIYFWSAPTGTQLGSPLQAHLGAINCMAISPDGSLLASASDDHTARLWNTVTRQPFGRVLQHSDMVYTVAFSPGGQFVATGGRECIIFLWDISQEGVIATAAVISGGNRDLGIASLRFSPDDKTFACASFDGTCTVWNSETGELLLDFDDHQNMVTTVAYSPSGVKIASGSHDHTIRIRNTHTGERLTQPLLHADAVRSIVWSPDSRQLISACNDGQIYFWSAPTGTQLGSPLQAHLGKINCMAISPSGSLLASASNDHTARLWNTITRQPFGRVLQHNDEVYTVAFSPSGQFVATGGMECIIFLWDISEEGVIATAAVSVSLLHAAPIPHFAGNADQPRPISGSLAGSLRPSISASDVPSDGAQGMSSLPITPAGLVDSEVPPISSSSTLTRDALQGAGRVASPHGTAPVPASPSSQSFFKRLFSKSDTHVASAEHSKPRKSTFFNTLL
ncbi:hypothetical protein PAXINDRAFT_171708 [Paxillus involutus ATCC 200175]|uniref:WD40 repeat-like protein n=1 Tax=Paxillus involutus ATCC 200175 TaxID=664439 RepID=A0A0C9TVD2_PAXIN|nr:hypothetical protein PAXINDRAFT_171708 [Paxillus involutus ATCC 200175]